MIGWRGTRDFGDIFNSSHGDLCDNDNRQWAASWSGNFASSLSAEKEEEEEKTLTYCGRDFGYAVKIVHSFTTAFHINFQIGTV